ncbi:hypothetical protein GCM10027275_38150 [Rhabdobacter roseus]|uniref:Cytochrome c1 n=1 Tax=Rhabdobacter roseus TaxID=1655419 RepID=A0A840TVZ2_9BACT|nr:hypothetical protein [Rhabdobacter roseus]MBB5285777.1 cytochrome c1 [Rhabdobacter roseus]
MSNDQEREKLRNYVEQAYESHKATQRRKKYLLITLVILSLLLVLSASLMYVFSCA